MLPAPAQHVVIQADFGGHVLDYSARVSAYLKRRVTVRIAGQCASACTMLAALPEDRICVAPDAALGFHQAYTPIPGRPYDASDRSEAGTAELERHYPNALRAWIDEHGGLTKDLIILRGADLARVFRICPAPGAISIAPVSAPVEFSRDQHHGR